MVSVPLETLLLPLVPFPSACQVQHWKGGHHRFCISPSDSGPLNPDEHIVSPTDEGLEECSICLESIGTSSSMCTLPCSHHFHADCVKSLRVFFTTQDIPCPLCRVKLPPEPELLYAQGCQIYRETLETGAISISSKRKEKVEEMIRLWRGASDQVNPAPLP